MLSTFSQAPQRTSTFQPGYKPRRNDGRSTERRENGENKGRKESGEKINASNVGSLVILKENAPNGKKK